MALAHVRAKSINSLEEGSLEAQQCSLFYEELRDQCLSERDWGFNTKIATLNELELDEFDWPYVWQWPTDCLAINQLLRNYPAYSSNSDADTGIEYAIRDYDQRQFRPSTDPKVEYRIALVNDTKVITTRESVMRAEYRARVTDPNLMPVHFRIALSYLIAAHIAIPLAGPKDGAALRSQNLDLYSAYKNEATHLANSQRSMAMAESDFITVREGT